MKSYFSTVLICLFSSMSFYAQSFLCNQGFESGNPRPTTIARVADLDCWDDNHYAVGQIVYHSPDWFVFNSFHLEEDLSIDGVYEPILGNSESDGYVGMRSCEMIKQELAQHLTKDKLYAVEFFLRIPKDGARANQDNSFQVSSGDIVTLEFIFKKQEDFYVNNRALCSDGNRCYDYWEGLNLQSFQRVKMQIDPSNYAPGSWVKLMTPPFAAKKDWEWVHMQTISDVTTTECEHYLLFDDVKIISEDGCDNFVSHAVIQSMVI